MLRMFLVANTFVLLLGSVPGSATAVLSENFDELTPALAVTSAGAFSTISGTNVDIVGRGLFGSLCAAPESGNCVDMDGTGGNSQGQLQSNMVFAAGNYLLSFDLIGSQRGITASTTVTLGNYSQTFTLASGDDTGGIVVNQAVTLTAPGPLLFVSNTPGDEGNLLDNVVVSTTAKSTVPEPSGLLLLGLMGLSTAIVVRRRKSKRARARRCGPADA